MTRPKEMEVEMDKEKLKTMKRPISSVARPVKGEAGNTGNWRSLRPVLIKEKCIMVKKGELSCLRCWLYCPEATISKTIPPKHDYTYCKGCGICAEECPAKAIEMQEEAKFREEEK